MTVEDGGGTLVAIPKFSTLTGEHTTPAVVGDGTIFWCDYSYSFPLADAPIYKFRVLDGNLGIHTMTDVVISAEDLAVAGPALEVVYVPARSVAADHPSAGRQQSEWTIRLALGL